jgi:hypothetical protein
VWKTYPYDLRSLLEALEDARLRSFHEGPQVLTVVAGRESQVIRHEHGKEVGSLSHTEIQHERGNGPPG